MKIALTIDGVDLDAKLDSRFGRRPLAPTALLEEAVPVLAAGGGGA